MIRDNNHPNLSPTVNYADDVPGFKFYGGSYMCKNSQKTNEHFLSINDFLNCVNAGAEIIIEWEKKTYSISWYNGKISVAQSYKQETEVLYETADAILNYKLESNEFLKDIITKAKIIDCTLYV